MSDTASKLFESLRTMKEGFQQGLGEAMAQTGAEMRRLGVQGSMELASALFTGNTFVPYGPGQYATSPEQEHQPEHQMESDRGLAR